MEDYQFTIILIILIYHTWRLGDQSDRIEHIVRMLGRMDSSLSALAAGRTTAEMSELMKLKAKQEEEGNITGIQW